jgi:hypothetical protein
MHVRRPTRAGRPPPNESTKRHTSLPLRSPCPLEVALPRADREASSPGPLELLVGAFAAIWVETGSPALGARGRLSGLARCSR